MKKSVIFYSLFLVFLHCIKSHSQGDLVYSIKINSSLSQFKPFKLSLLSIYDDYSFSNKYNQDNSECIPCIHTIHQKRFDELEYSTNLKKKLENFNFVIYNTNSISNGGLAFSTNYLGKRFLDDYYVVYQEDLTKYLPVVNNAPLYCPRRGF